MMSDAGRRSRLRCKDTKGLLSVGVSLVLWLCDFLFGLYEKAVDIGKGLNCASQPNPALIEASSWTRLKIRFVCAVAVFAFEQGNKKGARAKNRGKGAQQERPENEAKLRALPHTIPRKASNCGGAAAVVPALVNDKCDLSNLRQTLVCIRRQTASVACVYVVDDGSPVPFESLLTEGEKEGLTIIRSVYNEGPAAARNRGLQAARDAGMDYVCFTDSDCLPEATWVEIIMANFKKYPDVDIFGGITSAMGDNYVDQYHDAYGSVNGRLLDDGTLLYAPTCNMTIRLSTVKTRFDPVFPEAAFEDIDFCLNARYAGATIRLAEDMRVGHAYNSSLRGVVRQLERYGRSFPLMMKLHSDYLDLFRETANVSSKPLCTS